MADTPYREHRRDDRSEHRRNDRRDDRGQFDNNRRRVVLAQGMSVGTSGQPRWIPLDARFQPDRLQIDLRRGRAFIETITLVYIDGRRETLRVDRPLNQNERSIAINIDQRGLRGVMIDTGPRRFARGGGGGRRAAIVDVVGVRR